MSFQRRADERNLGALPYYPLHGESKHGGAQHVLTPIIGRESMWLGWTLTDGASVAGCSADNREINIVRIGALYAADALDGDGVAAPIDAASFAPCASLADAAPHLRFEVHDERNETIWRLWVTLCTPELYAQVSGNPATEPVAPEDSFGGFRLP